MSSRYNLRSKSKQPHLILSLPKEILEVILNYIPQKETLNVRLVCKAWNHDVETLYNHEVKHLKENSRHFQRILELRIQKLSIKTLRETSVQNSQGISIFKHPKTIRVLKIERFPSVSPENLKNMIRLCAATVRVLHFDLSHEQLNYEFTSKELLEGYKFTNLKELQITFYRNNQSQTIQENSKSLFQVLENSKIQKLKTLRIFLFSTIIIPLETQGRIGESILRILSQNGIHLEILDIDIFEYFTELEVAQFPLPLKKEELRRIMQMNRLQEVDVKFMPFAIQLKNVWKQLLSNQKQLVRLKTSHEFSGTPISIPLCRQIIINNSATLVKIKIWQLDLLPDDPPFDLSVFRACYNLKSLFLYRADVTKTDPEQPNVRQFHCLPESIKKLTLVRLNILSEELLLGFTQRFKNLRKLNFEMCGTHGPLGINWPVISSILLTSRPSLNEVSFIDSVNCEDESLEIELRRIGLSRSDLFELIRIGEPESDDLCEWFPRDPEDCDYSDSDD